LIHYFTLYSNILLQIVTMKNKNFEIIILKYTTYFNPYFYIKFFFNFKKKNNKTEKKKIIIMIILLNNQNNFDI